MFSNRTNPLIAASCLAVIMLSARVFQSCSLHYIFLAWNLLLAWVPYLISGYLPAKAGSRKWRTGLLLFAWLLFLPNAPYLVTDFIHLHKRPGIPLMYDLVMLFLFSFTGLTLGLLSIQRTELWCSKYSSKMLMPPWRITVFLLCGFGVYLGRVERWNSWDVLANPVELSTGILYKFIHPLANIYTWGATLLFALLLWMPYTLMKTLPATGKEHI